MELCRRKDERMRTNKLKERTKDHFSTDKSFLINIATHDNSLRAKGLPRLWALNIFVNKISNSSVCFLPNRCSMFASSFVSILKHKRSARMENERKQNCKQFRTFVARWFAEKHLIWSFEKFSYDWRQLYFQFSIESLITLTLIPDHDPRFCSFRFSRLDRF